MIFYCSIVLGNVPSIRETGARNRKTVLLLAPLFQLVCFHQIKPKKRALQPQCSLLKRETGIGPATFSLARRRSTTLLLAQSFVFLSLTCDSLILANPNLYVNAFLKIFSKFFRLRNSQYFSGIFFRFFKNTVDTEVSSCYLMVTG